MRATRTSAAALGALLGIASGLSCWLVIFRLGSGEMILYLPGTVLGAFIWLGGQLILGRPSMPVSRLCALLMTTTLAWRLARMAQVFGGPWQWFIASLLGALGTALGMSLAWSLQAHFRRLLLAMTLVGSAGGALFWLASTLRLYDSRHLWPLALLCTWHCALLTAAVLCLHGARRAA